MKDFKGFVYHNDISQKDIIEYLGVSKGYISLVISGKKKLSEENFRKLLENPYGWDTSMLIEDAQPQIEAENKPKLSDVEILLRDMLAEKDAKIDTLNEIIWELKEENGRLKEQLRQASSEKEKSVCIAEDSSVANAG